MKKAVLTKRGKYDPEPVFHRLTLDLSEPEYTKLKTLANAADRTASKQARVMILALLNKTNDRKTA